MQSSERPEIQLTEKFIRRYIEREFDPKAQRFIRMHYLNYWQVLLRHYRFDFRDTIRSVRNLLSWLWVKTGKKSFAAPLLGQQHIHQRFMDEVFAPERFELQFNRFLVELQQNRNLGGNLDSARGQETSLNSKGMEVVIKTTGKGQVAGRAVTTLMDLSMATLLSSEISRGAGTAAGIFAAKEVYYSQVPWWKSVWAKFFGVPGWVKATGAIIGTLMAFVLIVPFLAATAEYLGHRISKPQIRLRQHYPQLISQLLHGDALSNHKGLGEQAVEYLDSSTDAFDTVRTLTRAIT